MHNFFGSLGKNDVYVIIHDFINPLELCTLYFLSPILAHLSKLTIREESKHMQGAKDFYRESRILHKY